MYVKRQDLSRKISIALGRSRIVSLLGPRQCGKTTLARAFVKNLSKQTAYYDLENTEDLALLENPQTVLGSHRGLVIIDEIQRKPDLFPVLRVLADRKPLPAKFLILGSASPAIIRKSSESLAGRIEFIEMNGFALWEVGLKKRDILWLRGGMPNSYLARNLEDSRIWRENFIRTFIERDVPQLGYHFPSTTVRRFWQMVSHVHGQVWNGSQIGCSLGVSHTTVRRYLDLLTGAFMLRQLQPWHANLGKRLVKSPKIYFRDMGLLHQFLKIDTLRDLLGHPKLGLSWESFAMEQTFSRLGDHDSYFWATHAGAELDLLLIRQGKKWGFEFKFMEAPGITKSMQTAIKDLQLQKLWIVYPGNKNIPLTKKITLIGLSRLETIKF